MSDKGERTYRINRSLEPPREKVAEAEVVVVLVAHRYGWVPDAAENPGEKSITWLECERAWATKKEVLAFLLDPAFKWSPEFYERYRMVTEMDLPDRDYNDIREEVRRNEKTSRSSKRN